MKNSNFKIKNLTSAVCLLLALGSFVFAQERPPTPSAAKTVKIPAVKEKEMKNGLKVAVVERKNVPLVTVQLLVRGGAALEELEKAGLANMTASLLTKGTKTRTATQIAEQMEFLGGSISTGAGWNSSVVVVNVMSDKLEQAMAILSDVVLNPKFDEKELTLLKSQTLDNLNYNLKQPGFLANYVVSKYSFNEHPAGGTPLSIKNISRADIAGFHKDSYQADNAVLIFTGDITALKANALAQKYFGRWASDKKEIIQTLVESQVELPTGNGIGSGSSQKVPTVQRILVVDLPNSGQSSVNYVKLNEGGRFDLSAENRMSLNKSYFPALVLNSLLGGGYSSRLNQEIRIKRGLSYGAGSSFAWRYDTSNFSTRTQTKDVSAAEVAELVVAEINKLAEGSISGAELNPRKLVLTGDFGRDLETTGGLAAALADLYSFGISTGELNSYMNNVQTVSDTQIREFARQNLLGGDVVIVGDYAKFEADLKKRFPEMKVVVVKADNLDLDRLK